MRGYTLLELLVVLLVFSLLTGLTVPRVMNLYQRIQFNYQKEDIFSQLNGLAYKAFSNSKLYIIDNYSAVANENNLNLNTYPLDLPQDWSVSVTSPIKYNLNGFCEGGELNLIYREQTQHIVLMPPFCLTSVQK